MRKIGIVELIAAIGDEQIVLQNLADNITNCQKRKDGTAVTFMTDQITPTDLIFGAPKRTGLVIWFDAELGRETLAKLQGDNNGK